MPQELEDLQAGKNKGYIDGIKSEFTTFKVAKIDKSVIDKARMTPEKEVPQKNEGEKKGPTRLD